MEQAAIKQIQEAIDEAKLQGLFTQGGWAVIATIGTLAVWWIFFKRTQEMNFLTGCVILLMSSAGMVIS